MQKLGVAVIGTGTWGRNHVRVYKDLENASLLAIVDSNKAIAKEVGEKFNVKWYTDYEEVLKIKEIEAVSICTPTDTHAEIALKAIEAGKHVLVEKPLTKNIEEAKTLANSARKKGVYLSVGFIERFNPAVIEAKK